MKPSSFENAIRLQFDCLARKVIGRTVKNYNKELARRAKPVSYTHLSLSGATYGVYSDKGCTKSVATLMTDGNGNTDTVKLRAFT